MTLEEVYINFLKKLPGVSEPIRRLPFKAKIKWTGITLILYLLMSEIYLYGIQDTSFEQFQVLSMIMGSSFGTLMTLGIGPIVTASIILQLLVGSKLIGWDLQSESGRVMFQGTQKLLAIVFAFVEAVIFVMMGAIPASGPEFFIFVVLQLAAGGVLVIFMDELISKWGFGSGVSLFIAAGVSKTIIIGMFNPFMNEEGVPMGRIPQMIYFLGQGDPATALIVSFLPVIATVIVFFLVIYSNAIKVEIPLAFGSIRGFGRRWPLKFFYTSNLPVILVAALLANVQLMGRMLYEKGIPWLGTFSENQATGGLVYFLVPPRSPPIMGIMIFIGIFALIGAAIAYFTQKKGLKITALFAALGGVAWFGVASSLGLSSLLVIDPIDIARMFTYSCFMIIGAVVFSYFWMTTAGMDSASVAKQIESTGMQIPGYRRDVRIIEKVLNRYIPGLTILGGAAVGMLAAYADFTGALGTGTGILLATMIIYSLYEELAQQHMEDIHPALRKLMGKG